MGTLIQRFGQDYVNTASFELRITALKKMTGEQRMQMGLEMWRTACEISRDGIRAQFPHYSQIQVDQELARRIMVSNGAAEIISKIEQAKKVNRSE